MDSETSGRGLESSLTSHRLRPFCCGRSNGKAAATELSVEMRSERDVVQPARRPELRSELALAGSR